MAGIILAEVTEQNFNDEVLNSDIPVLACFTTSWCRACFPTCFVADRLAKEYEGSMKFVRVDMEKSRGIAERYHIIVVPTILFFQNSQPVKKLLGFQERRSLRDLLDALLAGGEAPIDVSGKHDEEA